MDVTAWKFPLFRIGYNVEQQATYAALYILTMCRYAVATINNSQQAIDIYIYNQKYKIKDQQKQTDAKFAPVKSQNGLDQPKFPHLS